MTKLESYWMTNKEWYYYDDDYTPQLTSKATSEAVKSFEKFKAQLKEKGDRV